MFRTFNDLKRAVQEDYGKGRPSKNEDSSSSVGSSTSFKELDDGTGSESSYSALKHTETTKKLNAQAKEFHPRYNGEITKSSSVPSADFFPFPKPEELSSPCSSPPAEYETSIPTDSEVFKPDNNLNGVVAVFKGGKVEDPATDTSALSKTINNDNLDKFSLEIDSLFGTSATLVYSAFNDPSSVMDKDLISLSDLINEKAQETNQRPRLLAHIATSVWLKDERKFFGPILINRLKVTTNFVYSRGKAYPNSYCPFIGFLAAFYSLVKEHNLFLETQNWEISPRRILLKLLALVCVDLLQQEELNNSEDIVFLTSIVVQIGRDLEKYQPKLMDYFMCALRNAYLSDSANTSVKQRLLQLLEIKSAKWMLPASTVLYYESIFCCY